jgi:hypothetical protein
LGQDVPADLFLELVELLDMPADGIGLRVVLAGSAEDVNFARNEHLFVATPAAGGAEDEEEEAAAVAASALRSATSAPVLTAAAIADARRERTARAALNKANTAQARAAQCLTSTSAAHSRTVARAADAGGRGRITADTEDELTSICKARILKPPW